MARTEIYTYDLIKSLSGNGGKLTLKKSHTGSKHLGPLFEEGDYKALSGEYTKAKGKSR